LLTSRGNVQDAIGLAADHEAMAGLDDLAEQLVSIPFAIHHVDRAAIREVLEALVEQLSPPIELDRTLVDLASGLSARTQRRVTRRRDQADYPKWGAVGFAEHQAHVGTEPLPTLLDASEPLTLALATEAERRRVVRDDDAASGGSTRRGLLHVRGQQLLRLHAGVVHEAVEGFELRVVLHLQRKAVSR
jgi:hypothetical protein